MGHVEYVRQHDSAVIRLVSVNCAIRDPACATCVMLQAAYTGAISGQICALTWCMRSGAQGCLQQWGTEGSHERTQNFACAMGRKREGNWGRELTVAQGHDGVGDVRAVHVRLEGGGGAGHGGLDL